LTQTLLKLTAPGVPDIYQGTDYWDLSFVDPDNRRPVDFAARMRSLGSTSLDELAANWRDGRIKQAVIARALAVRRTAPRLFAEGTYEPIEVEGPLARHVVAFARTRDNGVAITIVCRLMSRLLSGDGFSIQRLRWSGTRLRLPDTYRTAHLREAITGAEFHRQNPVDLAALFAGLPVALLVSLNVNE
jgi:maltooligosyltrehalose synthase